MHAGLEADRARVSEIQIQIVELEHTLFQLRIEQLKAQERLNSYKYPVLTLPSELISEIFLHVLPPYPYFLQLTGPFSPTPLTQICQKWRDIALGTPELWSAISSFDNNKDERELCIFELWLERSRHCPLSIKLGTDLDWASDELVAAVIPHRARWQYLKIELGSYNLRMLDGPMPLLRHLDVMVEEDMFESTFALHEVPLLRTLVLGNHAALGITFPSTQITSLTLIGIGPPECAPILVQTRNLIYCELHILNFEPHIKVEDVLLPCVQALSFIHLGGSLVKQFLPTFIVPALRSLRIPENFLSPDPIKSLTAFISKSGCGLEELHITYKMLAPRRSYRRAFPSLRKLAFDVGMTDEDGEI
ncbi:hypothetical protein DFH06DRAFT_1480331 [Mycena polygramma]|nr:hypothetical protein DFH06DRAFT_1480331 [Mycena polygramma]